MAANSAKSAAPTNETSESIASQVDAFLKSGGEIQKIETGVSGQKDYSGPRHITLGNKPRR